MQHRIALQSIAPVLGGIRTINTGRFFAAAFRRLPKFGAATGGGSGGGGGGRGRSGTGSGGLRGSDRDRITSLAAKKILLPHLFALREWSANQSFFESLIKRWHLTLQRMLPLGGASASDDNCITLYADGSDAFRAMWQSIQSAKKRIFYETFILAPNDGTAQSTAHTIDGAGFGLGLGFADAIVCCVVLCLRVQSVSQPSNY